MKYAENRKHDYIYNTFLYHGIITENRKKFDWEFFCLGIVSAFILGFAYCLGKIGGV